MDLAASKVIEPIGKVRTVRVHKRRTRYRLSGCAGEVADVAAGDRSTRTIAIESEDPSAVIDAVRRFGLEGYVNTSYPRGMRALIDGEPERYAVIDIGTNSVKFAIAEVNDAGASRRVVDRSPGLPDLPGRGARPLLLQVPRGVPGRVEYARAGGDAQRRYANRIDDGRGSNAPRLAYD